jgi:two-component system NtrC family sensor kinase
VFRVSLPVSGHAADDDAANPAAAGEPVEEESAARLLVVDDEPELVELMRAMLETAGYEVASAESGAVALALLDEARFDAIVSDLRMPDIDGAGLWRVVKERHPGLEQRMVFVTGDTLSPGAATFLQRAGCAHIEKPFAMPTLVRAVQQVLDRSD